MTSRRHRTAHWIFAALASFAGRAFAQSGDDAAGAAEATPGATEPSVVVHGTPARERSATEFTLPVGSLGQVPRLSTPQLLTLVPGAWISNDDSEGHAYSIALRGFNGDDGRDVALTLDGVPLNDESNPEGTGYGDTWFMIPELVDRLDATAGVADPRQGNFAVAGSVDFHLALRQRGATARVSLGSFGYQRLVGLVGPGTNEQTFVGLEVVHSNGYGAHRDNDRATAIAQYAWDLHRGLTARVLGSLYWSRWNSAGVLREDDLDAQRVDFYDSYALSRGQRGGSQRALGVFALDYRGEHDRAELRAYAALRAFEYRENFTGRLEDETEGDLETNGYRGGTVGAVAFYRHTLTVGGRAQDLEVGATLRHDRFASSTESLNALSLAPRAAPSSEDNTLDMAVTHAGAYVDLSLRPFDRFVLRGGARVDLFAYAIDSVTVDDDSMNTVTAHLQPLAARAGPKATAEVNLGRGFTALASYGTGFRSPAVLDIATTGAVPFTSVAGEELGVRYTLPHRDAATARLSATAAAFHTHVDQDTIFDPLSGHAVPLGPTERMGGTLWLRTQPTPWLDLAAAFTYVHAWSTADALDGMIRAGAALPYVPEIVVRLDAALDVPAGTFHGQPVRARAAFGGSFRSPTPLILGAASESTLLLDASAGVRVGAVTFDLAARNLTDARWRDVQFEYASNFTLGDQTSSAPVRHFTAGAPLNVYGTLTIAY